MTNNGIFHNNRSTFRSVLVLTGLIILTFIIGMKFQQQTDQVKALSIQLAQAKDKPERVVYVSPETVEDYIKYVFQEDAPKAFMLLKGKNLDGKGCHENAGLKWDAQNYNSDGSVDVGVFQINSKWQKVQPKFLYNYKVNIEIAHQLFEENGKSFKLWTAGKCLGI